MIVGLFCGMVSEVQLLRFWFTSHQVNTLSSANSYTVDEASVLSQALINSHSFFQIEEI